MRALRLVATCLCLAPASLAAQTGGGAPAVLLLPSSTRAMALGDAYMMNAGHADALFYHPALVAGAGGFGLDIQQWSGEATAATAAAAVDWFGGTVAVGLQTLQFEAASTDLGALSLAQDALFSGGPASTSERVATVGYARELFGVKVGLATKLIEQRVEGDREATGAVDVGLARAVGPITVGISAQNLGPDLNFADGDVSLPDRYTLGAGAYGRPVGPVDLGLTGALTLVDDDELIPAAGLEIGYWPVVGRTFVARVGVRRIPEGDASPVSVGFAFWGDDLVLEWAYQRVGGSVDQGTHRVGVRWR